MFLVLELPFEEKEQGSWSCLLQVFSCLFQRLIHLQTEVTNLWHVSDVIYLFLFHLLNPS